MVRKFGLVAIGPMLALMFAAACSSSTMPSLTLAAGTPTSPADQTSINYTDQPVTLTTTNGVAIGSNTITYVFEVASDAAFTTKVYTSGKVPLGTNGQTSHRLDRSLDGGTTATGAKTYYWRVQIFDGDEAAPYSASLRFSIKPPPVTVGVPTLVSPANGASTGTKPRFTINNSTQSGAVSITYTYQIAGDSAFANIVESGSVAQQTGTQTAWDAKTTLNGGATYYWRVSGNDSSGASSGYSSAFSFTTQTFDPLKTIWHNNPNIGPWAETAQITRVDFSEGYVIVDFDKRQGSGKWPEVPFGDGGDGKIQYCLGMCFFIQQQWHCSAVIQFWDGRDLYQGGNMNEIGINWYYDSRWGIMNGYQPRRGEIVAIFAVNGNVRDSMSWGQEQRTNFLLIPYGTNYTK